MGMATYCDGHGGRLQMGVVDVDWKDDGRGGRHELDPTREEQAHVKARGAQKTLRVPPQYLHLRLHCRNRRALAVVAILIATTLLCARWIHPTAAAARVQGPLERQPYDSREAIHYRIPALHPLHVATRIYRVLAARPAAQLPASLPPRAPPVQAYRRRHHRNPTVACPEGYLARRTARIAARRTTPHPRSRHRTQTTAAGNPPFHAHAAPAAITGLRCERRTCPPLFASRDRQIATSWLATRAFQQPSYVPPTLCSAASCYLLPAPLAPHQVETRGRHVTRSPSMKLSGPC